MYEVMIPGNFQRTLARNGHLLIQITRETLAWHATATF